MTQPVFNQHTPHSHDERIYRPNGELRWLHTWAMPVLDAEGKLERLVGVCQDVTEQRKAESAVRGQTMTRALARRLLHDIIEGARVPESIVRNLGQAVAREQEAKSTMADYVIAFHDIGVGQARRRRSGRAATSSTAGTCWSDGRPATSPRATSRWVSSKARWLP